MCAVIIIMHVYNRELLQWKYICCILEVCYCSGDLLKAKFIFIKQAEALRETLGSDTLIRVFGNITNTLKWRRGREIQ